MLEKKRSTGEHIFREVLVGGNPVKVHKSCYEDARKSQKPGHSMND
jgi:hypothetical protein